MTLPPDTRQAAGTIVVVARLTQGRILPAARQSGIGDDLTLQMRMTLRARGTQAALVSSKS